jgi:hypothetical protein
VRGRHEFIIDAIGEIGEPLLRIARAEIGRKTG